MHKPKELGHSTVLITSSLFGRFEDALIGFNEHGLASHGQQYGKLSSLNCQNVSVRTHWGSKVLARANHRLKGNSSLLVFEMFTAGCLFTPQTATE
jgi:hypothetical protein